MGNICKRKAAADFLERLPLVLFTLSMIRPIADLEKHAEHVINVLFFVQALISVQF